MTDIPNCTWKNYCLSEWCCPNRIENMFCICARNFDDMLESCEHDTRLPNTRSYLMRDVIEELEKKMSVCGSKLMFDGQDAYETAITLIKNGVKND